MPQDTGGKLNLKKPVGSDNIRLQTIGIDLPYNFQKIDDAFTAHQAESANKHIHSSGSDDDGYWIKYDDGTLTQTFTITVEQNFTAWLGWYRAVHNVEIPKPFIDNRYTVSVRAISSAGQIVQALGGSNTSITLYCYRPSETSGTTTTFIISATGRWK